MAHAAIENFPGFTRPRKSTSASLRSCRVTAQATSGDEPKWRAGLCAAREKAPDGGSDDFWCGLVPFSLEDLEPSITENARDPCSRVAEERGAGVSSKDQGRHLYGRRSLIWRIQLVSGFHLGQIWATNLRS
ncbi:MAG TPA: hypothetical protein VM818_15465 [Vicinamibacterales bacterium]|nr:hypothetical protein [Vicinamibacterales bacterium]